MPPIFPFEVKLLIYTRPFLRDEALEFEFHMGRRILDNMFDHMKIDETVKTVFFSFPERWLNVIEQHQIYERLEKYYPKLKSVQIKTHSPFIIQCTPAKCALMMDEPLPDYNDLCKHHYNENACNIFDLSKINVMGG